MYIYLYICVCVCIYIHTHQCHLYFSVKMGLSDGQPAFSQASFFVGQFLNSARNSSQHFGPSVGTMTLIWIGSMMK